ncbi:MAG: hypothetical protein DCF31_03810 [Alphaproteobacteria bacterium]|nr:MAG: hypothetical protein DCF31_03810 [Alphaproteobacteria bacterium]
MKALVAALLVTVATPAFADAAASFREARWPSAAAQGRAEGTVGSLILAGRAQLAIAAYDTRDKARALDLVAAAERDFDAALAKAPANPEAQLQKAVAIGYRAKLTRSPGLGKDARKRFEAVKAAHPDMALAWAAVAGWHGGAIATLGGFMAGTVLGAKEAEFDKGFAQAFRLEPTQPVHRVFYAMTLMDLDKGNAKRAAAALQGVGQLPARDGYEALVRGQGVQLAASLKAGDAKAAQVLARRLQAFGNLG